MVRALASHQCGPGSNPGINAMWVEFVVVSLLCSRGFSPGTPVFLSLKKQTFSNSNSTRNQVDEELLCRCSTSKSLNHYLFSLFEVGKMLERPRGQTVSNNFVPNCLS